MCDAGFTDITTLECLQRVLDVRSVSVPVANLGYGPANSYCDADAKPKLGNRPVIGCIETVQSGCHQKPKKIRYITDSGANNGDNEKDVSCVDDEENDEAAAEVSTETHTKAENMDSHKQPCTKALHHFKSALPLSQMTGHTGYLTFATLHPK